MRKAIMIVLAILLVFAVMVSGCASKAPSPAPAPDSSSPKPSADVNIANNDIPSVTDTEGIAIEEPDLSAETDVDFGSVI